jgi:hypothetical protein
MKYRDIEGNRRKILIELINRHNKLGVDKIVNFASIEIMNEVVEGDILKISFKDKNQEGKIFHGEISLWDVILNVL